MTVSNFIWWVIDHGHCILDAHYESLHLVNTKSSLSISFSIVCPSISETIGFLHNPGSNIEN